MTSIPLVEARNLKKHFKVANGLLHAVDGIDLKINRGSTVGVVGESGCGKSTLGRIMLRLLEPTDGDILYQGESIVGYNKRQMRKMRGNMQIIFQDPYSSLDPRFTVAQAIGEPFRIHRLAMNKGEQHKKVLKLMDTVGLARRLINSYPHELDGGRRQRIGIARALALGPRFIVCDEPVSALDVSIQAQILNLMKQLQRELGLTYLFITHDLSVVRHFSDDIAVMYLGRMVEKAPTEELFAHPLHPYTKALLSAIPVPNIDRRTERILLKGELSSPIEPAQVCRFSNRCRECIDRCKEEEPFMHEVSPGHFVSCFLTSGQ